LTIGTIEQHRIYSYFYERMRGYAYAHTKPVTSTCSVYDVFYFSERWKHVERDWSKDDERHIFF